MGLASAFSLNIWSEATIGGKDIMSAIEYIAADILDGILGVF